MSQAHCPCGSRIMACDMIEIKDGLDLYVYSCGVCGNQIEFVYETDPKKF